MVTRVGNDDPNTLNGTSDNDVLSGKGGSDNLYGFAGDDIFDPGTNPVGFVSPDYIDGGDGYDRLNFHPHRADGTIELSGTELLCQRHPLDRELVRAGALSRHGRQHGVPQFHWRHWR